MARPLRIEYEGALYHITARGNEQRNIFLDHADRLKFLSILNESYLKYGILLHCYVLMNNHYHLMLETPRANLSTAMHYINGKYTVYFNRKYKKVGHLFQGRYRSILVDRDAYLLELSRYIHLNPVRAGSVRSPEEYKWSSYRAYIEKGIHCPEWLFRSWIYEQFSLDEDRARTEYKKFIEEGLHQPLRNPIENTYAQVILGTEKFREEIKERLKSLKPQTEVPSIKKLTASSRTLVRIVNLVTKHFGVPKDIMISKGKRLNIPRLIAIYLCRKYTDANLSEISSYFGGMAYSSITQVVRRVEERRKRDRDFDTKIKNIEKDV